MYEIFTIGYGGRDTGIFLSLLERFEIDTLVDVRSQPYSRYRAEYSQRNLAQILDSKGIRYEFLGDLLGGRLSDRSCYKYSPKRKKEVLDHRLCETKDFYRTGLARLRQGLLQGRRIVIMCSELDPHECHRGYVLGRSLDSSDVEVIHIGRYGERLTQAEIPDLTYQEALL